MSTWTLVVHPQDEMRTELLTSMRQARGCRFGEIVDVPTFNDAAAAAVERGFAECALIVSATSLPRSASSSMEQPGNPRGLVLVRRMRKHGCISSAILVTDIADMKLGAAVSELGDSAIVALGTNWEHDFERELGRAFASAAWFRRSPCFTLEMVLCDSCKWNIKGLGIEDSGTIYIDPTTLQDLKESSNDFQDLVSLPNWSNHLLQVRKKLEVLFFNPLVNRKLTYTVIRAQEKFGGAKNSKIRFVVDDKTHPLILEAMPDLDPDRDDYWMLKAPIYRRYDRRGLGFPLFKDRASRREEINCLLIEADGAPGFAWGSWHPKLTRIGFEVQAVHDILLREKSMTGSVGKLKLFRAAEHRENAADHLQTILDEGDWHLVHFAGHSVRRGGDAIDDESGGLVLTTDPTEPGGSASVFPAKQFAKALGGVQFLYLSCCQSIDSFYVMSLLEEKLPAVLGYRWNVGDAGAEDYSSHFYHALFDIDSSSRKFLEYSFLSAKQSIYDAKKTDPTWAAPVLIMQVDTPVEEFESALVAR
jgi:hypothetical protein